jgi:hypothetical protein
VLTDPDCPVGEGGCNNPRVQRKEMEDVFNYGEYIRKIGTNDIALIKMKQKFLSTEFVQFACLPLTENLHNAEFQNATVIGWGRASLEQITKEDLIYHSLSVNI